MLMPVHGSDHFLNWFVSHFRMAAEFPPEFTAIPLEDIDPYYQNKKVEKSTIPVKLYINLVEWRPLSMEENFDNFLC